MTAQSISILEDMLHIAPMLVVGLWSLILLLADAFAGPGMRTTQRRLALLGLGIAFAWGVTLFGNSDYDGGVEVFFGFLVVDQFSLLLDLALVGIAAGILAFAGTYARAHRFEYGEQEPLFLVALFGMMTLVHANDLVALFLGIETMSIAVYVLVGARWNARESSEAALKYFLMGAFASALLLMGIALLYGAVGSTQLAVLREGISAVFTEWGAVAGVSKAMERGLVVSPHDLDRVVQGIAPAALFILGMLLVLAAVLFKIAAVPLHMWTPDAYDGAPTPTTAFMASCVKIASVAALLKIFVGVFNTHRLVTDPYGWTSVVAVLAFITMTVGNLAAVRQSNIKRLLAYSSIAHVGYMLVGVVAAANFYGNVHSVGMLELIERTEWARNAGDTAVSALLYYVVTYAIASAGAFAAVAWLGNNKVEAVRLHQWSGVARLHPGIAVAFTLCLVSLMGLPPLAGFFGKLFVFRAAFENSNEWLRWLVIAALVNSVIGAYYYLQIIVAMYFRDPPASAPETLPGYGAPIITAVAATVSVALGLFAGPFSQRTDLAASGFSMPVGRGRADTVDRLRLKWEAPQAGQAGGTSAEADATAIEQASDAAEGFAPAARNAPSEDGGPAVLRPTGGAEPTVPSPGSN